MDSHNERYVYGDEPTPSPSPELLRSLADKALEPGWVVTPVSPGEQDYRDHYLPD